MYRGIRNSESLQERKRNGCTISFTRNYTIWWNWKIGCVVSCGHNWTLFFLLLISKNVSETQSFSASNTNTLLNFPKLESHILVWKAFLSILQYRHFQHNFSFASNSCIACRRGCVWATWKWWDWIARTAVPSFSNTYVQRSMGFWLARETFPHSPISRLRAWCFFSLHGFLLRTDLQGQQFPLFMRLF